MVIQYLWAISILNFLHCSLAISSSIPVVKNSPRILKASPRSLPALPTQSVPAAPLNQLKPLPTTARGRSLLSPPGSFSNVPPIVAASALPITIIGFVQNMNAGMPLASIDEKATQEKTLHESQLKAAQDAQCLHDQKMAKEKIKQEFELNEKARLEQLQVDLDSRAKEFLVRWKTDLIHRKAQTIKHVKEHYKIQEISAIKQLIRKKINDGLSEHLEQNFRSRADANFIKPILERYALKESSGASSNEDWVKELNKQIDALEDTPNQDEQSGCCAVLFRLIRQGCNNQDAITDPRNLKKR